MTDRIKVIGCPDCGHELGYFYLRPDEKIECAACGSYWSVVQMCASMYYHQQQLKAEEDIEPVELPECTVLQ